MRCRSLEEWSTLITVLENLEHSRNKSCRSMTHVLASCFSKASKHASGSMICVCSAVSKTQSTIATCFSSGMLYKTKRPKQATSSIEYTLTDLDGTVHNHLFNSKWLEFRKTGYAWRMFLVGSAKTLGNHEDVFPSAP